MSSSASRHDTTSGRSFAQEIRLIFLFVLIYGAFGLQSPFFPEFLKQRGFEPSSIGLLLAMGTGLKLISAPLIGRIADRVASWSGVLALALLGCAVTTFGLFLGTSKLVLGSGVAAQAFFLGPVPTIADALALNSGSRISYGPVRGAGAGAFILFLSVSGQLVERAGIASIFAASALLTFFAAMLLHVRRGRAPAISARVASLSNADAIRTLLTIRRFRLVLIVSGIILGSHALHDSFTVLRWTAAGMSPSMIGLLWSVAVGSEVLVFFVLGRPLLRLLGPSGACILAGLVGALRWSVMAMTASVPAMLMIQPLHGITFALLHLACMQLITNSVPVPLAATAQGVYATLGPGLASVIVTSLSGFLFAKWGAGAFWAMALMSASSLLPAWRLKLIRSE